MHRTLSLLLLLSGLGLSILVPGGPVETRDFSHISPIILALFNSYLTALGVGSFMLAYFCFQRQRWAFKAAVLAGVSYLWVYAIDLARVFPTSPTPMPTALEVVEILGVLLALPMSIVATRLVCSQPLSMSTGRVAGGQRALILVSGALLFVLSACIILFATLAAMGRL